MNNLNRPLWTALVTPFNHDLTVDYHSLDRLLDEQLEAKNGLLILGSTGEALNINVDDKKNIVRHVMKRKLPVPIMVGVNGHDQTACLSWLEFLEGFAIDAYLMVTPLYAKPGAMGQYYWFKTLLDKSSKPVMLYNVPGRTACELSLDAVRKLASHDKFWSIKDASGSVEKFKQYCKASGNAPLYCGDDALFGDFAQAGSCGLISVASNIWPKETALFANRCLNGGELDHGLWERAIKSLFEASNPVPLKAILWAEQKIKNNLLVPPLSHEDLNSHDNLKKSNREIKNWFQKHS